MTIPDGVTIIGEWAFSGCRSLTTVLLPTSVTEIGCRAFDNCNSLSNLTIMEGVTSIGEWAFSGCTSLKELRLPASLKSIHVNAIPTSAGLIKRIPSDLGRIEVAKDNQYYCDDEGLLFDRDKRVLLKIPANYPAQVLIIPEGVEEIGTEAGKDCREIEEIIFPSTLKRICESAFEGCRKLKHASFQSGLEQIDYSAFYECALKTVELPETIKVVGKQGFASQFLNIGERSFVTIPRSVSEIGECAFGGFDEITVFDSITPDAKPCEEKIDAINGKCNGTVGWIGFNMQRNLIGYCAADTSQSPRLTINVLSSETGELKYRVKIPYRQKRNVLCTYASAWGKNASFCFPAIDALFQDLSSDAKLEYALYRMTEYRSGLSAEAEATMKKLIKRNAKAIATDLIQRNSVSKLADLESCDIIKKDCLEEYLNIANQYGASECSAYLIEWSNRNQKSLKRGNWSEHSHG